MKKIGLGFLVTILVVAAGPTTRFESRLHRRLAFTGQALPESFLRGTGHPRVGLYVGGGTWDTGREHLKMFLREHGYSYRSLETGDILGSVLDDQAVDILVMPGGESSDYLHDLGAAGAEKVRRFVRGGGGYLGICAGAFYATSRREGGNATGPYGIGLLEGTAYDGTALQTPPFIEGMMDFDRATHPLTAGLQSVYRIVLLGGASFRYSAAEASQKGIGVMMRYPQIHEPAMITFHFGEGRVFLSGPHLEIEENRTDWGPDYYDPESEWPILDRVVQALSSPASDSGI